MLCRWCEENIEELKIAKRLPRIYIDCTKTTEFDYYHMECLVRSIIGSVAHQDRRCPCYGGVDGEPEDLTKRENAISAYQYFCKKGF
jgi:hypothetical protein